MKETYENKGTETFLVCELQPGDQLEGLSLRALAGGKLNGFAPANFSQVGTTKYIRYDVTGKTPFFRLMKDPLTKKVLLGALNGIADALLSMEANQLDPGTVILDPAHVFIDKNTGETVMICMPLVSFRPGQAAGMLYSFILSNARLNSGEDSGFVTRLQSFLSTNPNPAPAVMKAELNKAETAESTPAASMASAIQPVQPIPEPPVQPLQQPQPRTDQPMSMFRLLEHHQEQAAREQAAREQAAKEQAAREQAAREQAEQKKMNARKLDFAIPGEPEIPAPAPIVSPEDTTVVEAKQVAAAHAYLVRLKNGERAPITKPFFRIGKEKSYVDYFISDNSAISRAHAYIVNKDGQYFLADTHSTNHTYINGGMISPDVETRLFHGAKVRFANEEFEFKLY